MRLGHSLTNSTSISCLLIAFCCVVVCIAFASGGTMTNGTDRVLESYISLIRYAEKDGNAHASRRKRDSLKRNRTELVIVERPARKSA